MGRGGRRPTRPITVKGDVLALGTVEGIPIITAREAVERLGLEDE